MRINNQLIFYTGITLFVLIQCLFIYKGIETSPFFNYGMFSESATKTHKKYYIKIDNKDVDWNKNYAFNKNVLLYNLENYEFALAGDTQVNKVALKRLQALHLMKHKEYTLSQICNNQPIQIYQNWFYRYLKREFKSAQYFEIGYTILGNQEQILESKILFKNDDERN